MALVLTEPFNDFTTNGWVLTNTPTIVSGRTGTSAEITGAAFAITKQVSAPSESDIMTVGFAFRITDANSGMNRDIFEFRSDDTVTTHNKLRLTTANTLIITRGTSTAIATIGTGVLVANTWYYIEIQIKLHDTTGYVIVKINGAEVANVIDIDTRNAGTKTKYDSIRMGTLATTTTHQFDDLYLRNDSSWQGDPTLNPDARLARADLRSLTTGIPIARMAQISVAGLFPLNVAEARMAQAELRALVEYVPPPVTCNEVWLYTGTGTEPFDENNRIPATVMLWEGAEMMAATAIKLWDGSAFVNPVCPEVVPDNVPPVAVFTFSVDDLTVDFTSTSTDSDGTIVSYLWDFDDSGTSTATNPSHTYATAGTYSVSFTVTDDDGATNTVSHDVTVAAPADCTEVLMEPFDNFSRWITTSNPPIISGRNGTAASMISLDTATYTIPVLNVSPYNTVGFAFRASALPSQASFCVFQLNGNNEIQIVVWADGHFSIARFGTSIGSSSPGLMSSGSWYYIEVQIFSHNSVGTAILKINGTTIISIIGVDTQQAGNPNELRISATSGFTFDFDDLYLTTGPDCTFKGDITIPTPTVDVLYEPFNHLASWTLASSPTIVAGRTGTAVQINSSLDKATYLIPVAAQSDTLTVGFAFRFTDATVTTRDVLELRSDSVGGTLENALRLNPSIGVLSFNKGASFVLASSAAGVIIVNTWYYIEVQVKLADVDGEAKIRVNGVTVIDMAGQETSNSVQIVYSAVRLSSGLSSTDHQYDDLYISMGPTATFKGDISLA